MFAYASVGNQIANQKKHIFEYDTSPNLNQKSRRKEEVYTIPIYMHLYAYIYTLIYFPRICGSYQTSNTQISPCSLAQGTPLKALMVL